MKCSRTACNSDRAVCYHRLDRRWYCPKCAHAINENNPSMADGKPLITFPISQSGVIDLFVARLRALDDDELCKVFKMLFPGELTRVYDDRSMVELYLISDAPVR